jgi:hypothetical protein
MIAVHEKSCPLHVFENFPVHHFVMKVQFQIQFRSRERDNSVPEQTREFLEQRMIHIDIIFPYDTGLYSIKSKFIIEFITVINNIMLHNSRAL